MSAVTQILSKSDFLYYIRTPKQTHIIMAYTRKQARLIEWTQYRHIKWGQMMKWWLIEEGVVICMYERDSQNGCKIWE